MAILSMALVVIAIEGRYAIIRLARLAKASILIRQNARVARPIPVERSACNTGAVFFKVRLLWLAQSAGKILKLVNNGLAIAVTSLNRRVFKNTCAKNTINNDITFSLSLIYLHLLFGNFFYRINFHCNRLKIPERQNLDSRIQTLEKRSKTLGPLHARQT
jgi:hypothetical protein